MIVSQMDSISRSDDFFNQIGEQNKDVAHNAGSLVKDGDTYRVVEKPLGFVVGERIIGPLIDKISNLGSSFFSYIDKTLTFPGAEAAEIKAEVHGDDKGKGFGGSVKVEEKNIGVGGHFDKNPGGKSYGGAVTVKKEDVSLHGHFDKNPGGKSYGGGVTYGKGDSSVSVGVQKNGGTTTFQGGATIKW